MKKNKFGLFAVLSFSILFGGIGYAARTSRAQYPQWLANSYIDFGIAYQHYPILSTHLNPNSSAVSVHVPATGVRLTLLGRNFTEHFSAQIMYFRPVKWMVYKDENGISSARSITNVGGLTGRWTIPLQGPTSAYFESGLGIVTRSRVVINDQEIVRDANYPTLLMGTGVKYRLNRIWDIQMGGIYLPPSGKFRQPSTTVLSAGAVLNIRSLSVDQVRDNAVSDHLFPKHLAQIGVVTNKFGTGANRFVSGGAIPLFWGGLAEVGTGYTARYKRNVFHTKKIFALDFGLSAGTWQSVGQKTAFKTFSVFPQFRFILFRSKLADLYWSYSLAGPTFITKTKVNGYDTGKHFTFQDLMDVGIYAGKQKRINFEVGIGHYSNGNLFLRNAGIKIPLTFSVGYAFW